MNDSDKYFIEEYEFESMFQKGNFGQHITITSHREPLSFAYLEQIIISNPYNDYGMFFENAVKSINYIVSISKIETELKIRKCSAACNCRSFYANNYNVEKHFKI